MSRRLHAALLVLSVAVLAGCGGGDDDDAESDDPAAAFQTEASAICLAGAAENTVDVSMEVGYEETDESELMEVARFEEVLAQTDDELRALEPPADLADTYAEFLDVRDAANVERGEVVEALQAGDRAGADAGYDRITELDRESWALAEELGLEGCDYTLPAEEQAEIEETVDMIASSTDGELICEEYIYPEFIEAVFRGGFDRCVAFQEDPANVSEVSIESVAGYDGTSATAIYTKVGGSDDGLRLSDRLFYDEEVGHWRLWDSVGTG